ncbi:alpha-D-ribose 1-methylphosphonate 5-triphosphate diphosphatase [Primorskyibacter aestuariivivens]|uniref:alpha-D-ribose 1-methylphosphonate 5-triphosphate diphosphatase n=1 Tax=Primorskyibacter aestuariivivens TaxID=1888912 RepID=UPI002301139A|nr:alpha-D-ribose 1-methylphosphonate 5-triphosphate diphosphatase [Primorskyibacter aestuariivivens]MDA7428158.1 alpha-D-ribose 1-methylphosphonate 5-triphosphate diphosphatase [Primorskyibacter aestuariivivens]
MTTIDLTFHGADWLAPDGLHDTPLSISGGHIGGTGRAVDLSGKLILPGIVDLHGDAFEHHIAPRRGAMTDATAGILAAEADLAANGITTAVLAQFYSWEGGMRSPEAARRMLSATEAAQKLVGTDLRVQLRLETHMLDDFPEVLDLLDRYDVRYVAFNDHLPHERLATGRSIPRLTGTALKSGRSPEKHLALMQALHARSHEVPAALEALCKTLTARGVHMASHDDASAGDRATWAARGVSISEFPESFEAAEAARDAGAPTILGAPNLVRGASHKGNASAFEMVKRGLATALASDYHYPSLRGAVWKLVDAGTLPLHEAWALVSANPARMIGLSDRGSLAPGHRADLIILDAATRRIEATLSGGRITCLTGDTAARLISFASEPSLA